MNRKVRMGSVIALTGLGLAFILAWHLADPTPFTVVGGAAVAGKWWENIQERRDGG